MKRTLIVATTSYAGMGPYVSEIVNTFSPEDDVYFFFHDYEDDFFKRNIKKELHKKSVFFKQANSALNKLKELLFNSEGYDWLFFELCKEYKIQLVHYINGIPTVKMQRKLQSMGIHVLSTVHDLEPHEAKKAWYKMLRQRISYKRLKENLIEAKCLVTNSVEQYHNLKKKFPDKQVSYHSFPSLVSKGILDGHVVPKELKELDKPYILFFGRIEAYKGISLLYHSFMECEELQKKYYLVVAGNGELGFERMKYDSNVKFINRYILDSEIAYMYQNAKCVIYPYISATQSGVLSLAFYYRTPVLASDVPFFKSIIDVSQGGLLFKNGDKDDLIRKLLCLLGQDNIEMKRKQELYYSTHFNEKAIRTSLLKIYSLEWNEKYM